MTNDEFQRLLSRIYSFIDRVTPCEVPRFFFFQLFYGFCAFFIIGMILDTSTGDWPLWWIPTTLATLLPTIVIIINAPILWLRTRTPAKERRLAQMQEDIARLERELDIR